MTRKNTYFLLGAFLTLIGYIFGFSQKRLLSNSEIKQPQNSTSITKVTRVYDGDTVQISTGEKVRYIGIDAAEIYPKVLCFSNEAKKENEEMVLGKEAELISDVSNKDKYGRLLRYVYIDGKFINDELVRLGYAKVMTVSPDVRYKDIFLESEKYARENKLGLWGKCF